MSCPSPSTGTVDAFKHHSIDMDEIFSALRAVQTEYAHVEARGEALTEQLATYRTTWDQSIHTMEDIQKYRSSSMNQQWQLYDICSNKQAIQAIQVDQIDTYTQQIEQQAFSILQTLQMRSQQLHDSIHVIEMTNQGNTSVVSTPTTDACMTKVLADTHNEVSTSMTDGTSSSSESINPSTLTSITYVTDTKIMDNDSDNSSSSMTASATMDATTRPSTTSTSSIVNSSTTTPSTSSLLTTYLTQYRTEEYQRMMIKVQAHKALVDAVTTARQQVQDAQSTFATMSTQLQFTQSTYTHVMEQYTITRKEADASVATFHSTKAAVEALSLDLSIVQTAQQDASSRTAMIRKSLEQTNQRYEACQKRLRTLQNSLQRNMTKERKDMGQGKAKGGRGKNEM